MTPEQFQTLMHELESIRETLCLIGGIAVGIMAGVIVYHWKH